MRIRKLKLNRELVYPREGGEIVRCPVCLAVWMEDDERESSPCEHLRFVYCTHDPGFVFFAGTWDHASFEASFERFCDTEDGADEREVFKAPNDPDVDAIVYWDWDDFPRIGWSTFWGYKTGHSRPSEGRGHQVRDQTLIHRLVIWLPPVNKMRPPTAAVYLERIFARTKLRLLCQHRKSHPQTQRPMQRRQCRSSRSRPALA